jgi:hypothetical protein
MFESKIKNYSERDAFLLHTEYAMNNDVSGVVHPTTCEGDTETLYHAMGDMQPLTAVVYQGHYIPTELYQLIQRVSKKLRGASFDVLPHRSAYNYVYRHNSDWSYGDNPDDKYTQYTLQREVYITFANSTYVVGKLGFDDTRRDKARKRPEYKLYVHSPYINNYKYAIYSKQHNLLASKSIDVVARNAAKFIRPTTTKDLVEISVSLSDLGDAVNERANEYRDELWRAKDTVRAYHDDIAMALYEVMQTEPHVTMPDTVRRVVTEYGDYKRMREEVTGLKVEGVHVLKADDRYYVTEVPDLRAYNKLNDSEPMPYNEDTLPAWIKAGMSMVMLAGKGHYVDGVGMMLNDNACVVERGMDE